jgi:hypothetical protein
LGELLDVNYETLPLLSLYRASDVLWKRHAVLEHSLFAKTCDLFNLDTTVTLYDLTNTYFEGEVPNNCKACSELVEAALRRSSGQVLLRSSQTFAGNVAEAGTRLSKYSNFKCILISRLMDSNRLKNRLELIDNRC